MMSVKKLIKNQYMLLVHNSKWQEEPTFRMIPVDKDCPFNEVIYDPKEKVLVIISKTQMEKPQLLPKVDEKGQIVRLKNGQIVQERRIMKVNYEYYLEERKDILDFVNRYSVNPSHPVLSILTTIDDVLTDPAE